MTSTLHHFMAGSMREETIGKVRRLFGGGDDFVCGGGGEPFIIPYVNLFAIVHSTSSSLSNDFHVVENASPGVGRIRAKRCTKDVTEREVTRFKDPGNEGSNALW